MNSIRYACIAGMSLLLFLIFAPKSPAQQAVTPLENRIDVAQIPLPEATIEMIEEVRELLDSLPPVRMGWLDSFPLIDGKYYFGGRPLDQQYVDSALFFTESTPHTDTYGFGLRRQFPPKVKERLLALRPGSIDALLSIMIDNIEAPVLQVPTVLSVLWASLSTEQKDMYLRHRVQPYIEVKPRYEKGTEEYIRAGFEMRLFWPATEPIQPPISSTNIYLDGNIARKISSSLDSSYGIGIVRHGSPYNVLSVKVSGLGLGRHTIRSVTNYEFVCEGRTYVGVSDSGEVPFEVIQPFLANQLAAQPDPHIDRLVREHVKFLEINPRSIWTKEVAEIIAWEPTYSTRVNDSEGYAFHLPILRIDGPLPVSLAYDVEFQLLDNGEIFAGSPVTLSNHQRRTAGDATRTAMGQMAASEAILPCPEGAATLCGLRELVSRGLVGPDDTVVLLNTGSGLKYLDLLE